MKLDKPVTALHTCNRKYANDMGRAWTRYMTKRVDELTWPAAAEETIDSAQPSRTPQRAPAIDVS